MTLKKSLCASAALALALSAGTSAAQDQSIIVQSTTSTANSGLYDYLLPIFAEQSGIEVNVVAVGTTVMAPFEKNREDLSHENRLFPNISFPDPSSKDVE